MKKFRSAIITILLFFNACTILSPGENVLIEEVYNKQESKKAVLFIKYGNATLDNSFHIIIEGYDYEIDKTENGNVFIADSDNGSVPIDSTSVSAKWISNDSIIVTYDHRLRLFKNDSLFYDVNIIYEQK